MKKRLYAMDLETVKEVLEVRKESQILNYIRLSNGTELLMCNIHGGI